jgi:mRNA interferase MazF
MNRGEIWWVALPTPQGSEPGYDRPILVVQNDEFNRSNINTVIGMSITSNLSLAAAPGNVLLRSSVSGLQKDSVANVSQIVTVDKRFLTELVGKVDRRTMQCIDDGLRMVLAL